jgi:hypothetical protein
MQERAEWAVQREDRACFAEGTARASRYSTVADPPIIVAPPEA